MTVRSTATVVVAAALLGALPAAAAPEGKALLRIADRHPLVVTGTGFRAGEVVQLTAAAGATATARAKASVAGRFQAAFRLDVGRCARVTVLAVGSRGTRARLLTPVSIDCVSRY